MLEIGVGSGNLRPQVVREFSPAFEGIFEMAPENGVELETTIFDRRVRQIGVDWGY